MGRTISSAERKTKKSYTLSPEIVAFLEAMRKERKAASTSFILEEILQSARREHERALVEGAISDYYSGLSEVEKKEQVLWGEFALSQISGEERD